MCLYLDLTTRSGLKRIHAKFDAIYRKLDKACQRYPENERIIGGVVVIYSKMCVDAILRNKLHERGLLSKLLPLVDLNSCRDSERHRKGNNVNPTGSVLKIVTETSKKEWASQYLINHALGPLATSTLNASDVCKVYPPMLRYLVAGLRGSGWVVRCTSLGGIIRLHRDESEMDMRTMDPMKFMGREVMDIGLPFIRWIDALPPCARAIRTRAIGKEEDLADILDIEFYIMKQRIPDAVELARKGLKRNPGQAYFYYAITLSADHTEGQRAAKKGLMYKQITPFVRFQLLSALWSMQATWAS
ncbi:hypothetical protein H0H87_012053 [Tephrocybe sp. NHM501043]|nr:hypothetical protein H0H87_012053 [Tephrocybe sp. NHM501043]